MPRIDKVRLDNYYHSAGSAPVRRNGSNQASESPFPFDPDEKGVIYEPSGVSKPERVAPTAEPKAPELSSAAALELEGTEAPPEPGEASAVSPGIGERLRELGSRLLSILRSVWDNIWNGPDGAANVKPANVKPEDAAETVAQSGLEQTIPVTAEAPDVEAASSPAAPQTPRDALLQEIIADHDMDRLVRFVTENGTKKPARSTDLLTIYNRQGRVNVIDPSDRKKILEGTYHDLKL